MAKLLISTQVYENYGAHDWNGTGEVPQYWKAKGGMDYVVRNFKGDCSPTGPAMMSVWNQVECSNEYFRETIIDSRIVSDDYLTEFERDQLEFEGKIRFSPKELFI
jgi:hypothetical protein